MRSILQQSVAQFMKKAGKPILPSPGVPSDEMRTLCGKLIAEESTELLAELGFTLRNGVLVSNGNSMPSVGKVAKEACDLHYVVAYLMLAFGLDDWEFQMAVNENNLAKFGPGHWMREDGKLMPPPGFKKIEFLL